MTPIMTTAREVLGVIALVLFGFAATPWCPEPPRTRVIALGLCFLTAAFFVFIAH